MEKGRVIFTHKSADLDSACSVWAAVKYIFKEDLRKFDFYKRVIQEEARWNGAEMKDGDVAVDIDAGGKGIKGEITPKTMVGSAFGKIMETYAPLEDQKAIESLVRYVEEYDSCGVAFDGMLEDINDIYQQIILDTSVNAVFRGLQAAMHNDAHVFKTFSSILSGMLSIQKKRVWAKNNYHNYTKWFYNNQVVLTENAPMSVSAYVYKIGARIVIFKEFLPDTNEYVYGIKRNDTEKIRVDDESIRAVIQKYGESEKWFAHEAGFLYSYATRKSTQKEPSLVPERELIDAVVELLKKSKTQEKKCA